MERVSIGYGRWFDRDAATAFEESRHFDGQNYISDATGDQWLHERLYRTRSGAWVLHEWSDWQGSSESWTVVDTARAHAWLIAQGHESAVPAEAVAAAEI